MRPLIQKLTETFSPSGCETAIREVIRAEIDRLNRIVRDFLELARPSEPTPSLRGPKGRGNLGHPPEGIASSAAPPRNT